MGARLENKVAFITGAGRGIGRAIAHKMADEGATDEQIKTILSVENMPNRMKGLIELKKAGDQFSFDDVYNSYIIIK